MLHGNGGANARFRLFELLAQQQKANFRIHLPQLPGFEGRALPKMEDAWSPFLETLANEVKEKETDDWIYYGHGIGGSILMEWAKRNWAAADGATYPPKAIILHSCIGASLQERFFPKLMRPLWVRKLIQQLIAAPLLRPFWEQKLFLFPENIPSELRKQFFVDYKNCQAFSVFFDLITPEWYKEVQECLQEESFHFLWGEKERVVAAKYLELWKKDFPKSYFEVISDWDHFPMMEQVESFYEEINRLVNQIQSHE